MYGGIGGLALHLKGDALPPELTRRGNGQRLANAAFLLSVRVPAVCDRDSGC